MARVALVVAALLVCMSAAHAEYRIENDRGGQIGDYMLRFETLRDSGERVVIDGNCLSACTLVLHYIPRSRLCATRRGVLGFHAAWMPDWDGQAVTSARGTQALWDLYPRWVRHMIGTLTAKLRTFPAARFVPACR